jgi:deoxyhypusine synthase
MVKDPKCKVVLTLSGAMTIAKMGKVICKMIDTGMVQAVVSTGALMAHNGWYADMVRYQRLEQDVEESL